MNNDESLETAREWIKNCCNDMVKHLKLRDVEVASLLCEKMSKLLYYERDRFEI